MWLVCIALPMNSTIVNGSFIIDNNVEYISFLNTFNPLSTELNNNVGNLEWVDNKTNTKHGYNNDLYHSNKRCIQVKVFDLDGNYINTYKSIRETAEMLNINRKTLSAILFTGKDNNYNYRFEAVL